MGTHFKITADGPDNFRRSNTYRKKAAEIRNDIRVKYQSQIDNEPGYFTKLILKLKRDIDIRREISKLDSPENMFGKTDL